MIEKIVIAVSWMITGIVIWELVWRRLFVYLFAKDKLNAKDKK